MATIDSLVEATLIGDDDLFLVDQGGEGKKIKRGNISVPHEKTLNRNAVGAHDAIYNRQFATLDGAVATNGLVDGISIEVKERSLGLGGGAVWDVLDSTVNPPNGFDAVLTSNPNLSLVLRNRSKHLTTSSIGASGVSDDEMEYLSLTSGVLDVFVDSSITLNASHTISKNINLIFESGGSIHVASGATLTILGEVIAPQTEIFSGDGNISLDNSASGYNLGWFSAGTDSINDRWDFAKRGMATFRRKTVYFPRPREGQTGAVKIGNRLFWGFNGPILFTDDQNACTVHVDCEFTATAPTSAMLIFEDTAKPENIYFYGDLQALVSPTEVVNYGIDIRSVARLSFFGNIVLNGFRTPIRIGSADMVQAVGDVFMPEVQLSFFYNKALEIRGKSAINPCQGVKIGKLTCTAAQVAGINAVEWRGLLRNVEIESITYATDIPKDGYLAFDVANVLSLNSDTAGLEMMHSRVGAIYQANATQCLEIKSSVSAATLIRDIKISNIFGKFNGSAANINHCVRVTIDSILNSSDVTVGSGASLCKINSNAGLRNLVNNGNNTIINNLGYQTRGGGVPPSPAVAWPIGTDILETSDGKIYKRVYNAGLASDFIALN